ncbi:death-inducer obliterator 1-like [Lolium rigidum]|uniref:death-inducer obliterator 1-like n=1 Tax=Lolium rigidum TaxID=89674 RepID=UPI001F5DA0BF|nr:death-inducer obliterator 1-like [Lolium rigidum]
MGLTKQEHRPQPPLPSAIHRSAHPVSPKVQMLKPLPSPFSAGKRFAQKELSPRAHPQAQLDPFRSKFRETLAAALSMDPDHHSGQQSAGNVSPVISQPNPKRARMSDGVNASQTGPESDTETITDGATEERKGRIRKAQSLAVTIEEELFKLFGEVNKKYKAKSRSLVFNLKNKNNPALMERVLSGDIPPKCLCAMTKEELASKDLSEWRMDQTSVQEEVKESDNSVQDGVAETCNDNTSSNLDYPANEKSDMTEEPMVDDLQDTENLPEIMTLDEFLDLFYSETHFEDQSAGALQDDPSIDKADKALKSQSSPIAKDDAGALKFQFHSDLRSPQDTFESKLESPVKKSVSMLDPVVESKGDVIFESPPEKVDAEKPDTLNGLIPESDMQCKISPDAALIHGSIWEGAIKLSLTSRSRTNIVAIFKSGEKLSTNEWPRLLGINGKTSLSELKKYLEELPKSRRRAITCTCSQSGHWDAIKFKIGCNVSTVLKVLLQSATNVSSISRRNRIYAVEWM